MGCEFSSMNKIDDCSTMSSDDSDVVEKDTIKQRLFLVPRDLIQYSKPPSVQKFLNPTQYRRDEEVYINRTIEPDVVGERRDITAEEKPVIYQLERERRQKVWEYRADVEIPKYRKNDGDRWTNRQLGSSLKAEYTHLKPDVNCFLCGVYTNTKTYPCRVCLRSFHDACLQKFGKLDPLPRALMVNRAETEEGWSCFNCDNLVLELFEDEVAELQQLAHRCNLNPEIDTDITKEEYIAFRSKQFTSEKVVDKITEEEEIRAKQEFWILDSKKIGSLGMRDFLNHEAIKKLAKRPQKDLVNLLSEKEIYDLEMTFRELDKDGDGMILVGEARLIYTRWLKNLLVVSDGILPRSNISAPILVDDERKIGDATQAPVVQDADRGSGFVSWQEYLLDQAIYVLASRLNKPAVHVAVNELELKKPSGERKVVFAADNKNIKIKHSGIHTIALTPEVLTMSVNPENTRDHIYVQKMIAVAKQTTSESIKDPRHNTPDNQTPVRKAIPVGKDIDESFAVRDVEDKPPTKSETELGEEEQKNSENSTQNTHSMEENSGYAENLEIVMVHKGIDFVEI